MSPRIVWFIVGLSVGLAITTALFIR